MQKAGCFPMKVVARRTGLSPHVIRVWERRYEAVQPIRSESNRRLYSEEDIRRLDLLRRATEAGLAIGQIAALPDDELGNLLATEALAAPATVVPGSSQPDPNAVKTTPGEVCQAALRAVSEMDGNQLGALLGQAAVSHSQPVLLEQILVPLLIQIGDRWRQGKLRPAHEHLASSVIRGFLANISGAYAIHETAPVLVVTTPVGQLHELGAMLVATAAAAEGWRVTYLGPNLPAEEIAATITQSGAQAVALSIVYPMDDPRIGDELRRLAAHLADSVLLLVGGRAAGGYRDMIDEIGGVLIDNLADLRFRLERIRQATGPR